MMRLAKDKDRLHHRTGLGVAGGHGADDKGRDEHRPPQLFAW